MPSSDELCNDLRGSFNFIPYRLITCLSPRDDQIVYSCMIYGIRPSPLLHCQGKAIRTKDSGLTSIHGVGIWPLVMKYVGSYTGQVIYTDCQDGSVSTWDIGTMISEQSDSPTMVSQRKLASGTLVSRYKLTSDAIGSVQLHPFKPLVMAAAGSRGVSSQRDHSDSSESESDSGDDDADDETEPANTPDRRYLAGRSSVTKSRKTLDDSLRIWSFA